LVSSLAAWLTSLMAKTGRQVGPSFRTLRSQLWLNVK
jgi:hypothetical protein